jgi:hypothetical protein
MTAEIFRHPAPALHTEHALTGVFGGKHIERQYCLLANPAVGLQPLADLVTFYRGDNCGIMSDELR